MKNSKDKLIDYLETIKITNKELKDLIDIDKVSKNVDKELMNLNKLNFILDSNEDEVKRKIKVLYKEDPKCFESFLILIACRENKMKVIENNEEKYVHSFLEDEDSIIKLATETNFIKLIISGKIKNLVDYATGVEIGIDTNARKNRCGLKIENMIEKRLKKIFKDRKEITIESQKQISLKNGFIDIKNFDFVITNNNTLEKILIESSFYNAGGSKINETAKSFKQINQIIKEYENHKFIWLADGYGMTTIKKF